MGNRIIDPKYGEGTIINIEEAEEGYWVTVRFDNGLENTFMSYVNPLEIESKSGIAWVAIPFFIVWCYNKLVEKTWIGRIVIYIGITLKQLLQTNVTAADCRQSKY